MTLTFPTLAEQALAAFNAKTKTAPLVQFVKKFGGTRAPDQNFGQVAVYVFDDDTTLEVTGRGLAYKVTACLP